MVTMLVVCYDLEPKLSKKKSRRQLVSSNTCFTVIIIFIREKIFFDVKEMDNSLKSKKKEKMMFELFYNKRNLGDCFDSGGNGTNSTNSWKFEDVGLLGRLISTILSFLYLQI